jgi:hypothetical protein
LLYGLLDLGLTQPGWLGVWLADRRWMTRVRLVGGNRAQEAIVHRVDDGHLLFAIAFNNDRLAAARAIDNLARTAGKLGLVDGQGVNHTYNAIPGLSLELVAHRGQRKPECVGPV